MQNKKFSCIKMQHLSIVLRFTAFIPIFRQTPELGERRTEPTHITGTWHIIDKKSLQNLVKTGKQFL